MIHHLGNLSNDFDGFATLAQLVGESHGLKFGKLELDLAQCRWVETAMLTPLGACLGSIADRYNTIEIVGASQIHERRMLKCGFLQNYGYTGESEAQSRTILPFRRLRLSDWGEFENYLQTNLPGKGFVSISKGAGRALKQGVFEVFQNAVMHSDSKIGVFVGGEFDPSQQRLELALADAGIGISTSVNRYLKKKKLSDAKAIRWAFALGNTTKRGRQPGGVGLKVLREFIGRNHGHLVVASGNGLYEYSDNRVVEQNLPDRLPGTMVTLEINTADIKSYALVEEISAKNIF